VNIFSAVEADPSDHTVLQAVAYAKSVAAEIIIGFGFGGGSSIDVAKLVALLHHPTTHKHYQKYMA
jgi:alcohol dehydrogenase